MKKILLTCIFASMSLLGRAQITTASDISQKWGKVTKDELEMTTYKPDTSAAAVVLYQQRYSKYDYDDNSGFMVNNYVSEKIKILKQEGKEEGTISIPYYFYTKSSKDAVSGIEAWTYNLENGKVVKKKLDKQYLFDEEYNDHMHRIKFSMPDVKVGSVIEYKYLLTSQSTGNLPDWDIQRDIPVMNNDFQVLIPEYYDFSISVKGFEMLDIKETQENATYTVVATQYGTGVLTCLIRKLQCIAQDIPAMKEEDYVWCMDDYLSGVRFELRGTRFPHAAYHPFTQTWESLEKAINEDSELAMSLKMGNPWKEETARLVAGMTDENEKIAALYDFVKKRIRWNDRYSLFGGMPREAVKNGTGNNSQINMVLMSVLRDADIKTYPILLSQRSKGRLPVTNASINQLGTFIVAAMTKDSSIVYLDGSAKYGGPNLLPSELLVDRARVFDKKNPDKWVDLTKLTRNFQLSSIQASIDKNGMVRGTRTTSYTNLEAYDYKSEFADSKDSMEFVKNIQNTYDVTLDSLEISGKEPTSNNVNERMVFGKQMDVAGDYIYVNAMIFKHLADNPFTQMERKLPVEFEYPYGYQTLCTFVIPDGYQVEERPKSVKYVLPNNVGVCQFITQQTGNTLVLKYVFQMNQTVFLQTEYPLIRDFFGQAAAKNMEVIVLKKIA